MSATIDVSVGVKMTDVLSLLISAFDTSAIAYWLRRADEEDGLYGKDGEVHEVQWPNGEEVDPSTLAWLPESDKPWNARLLYFAPLVEGGSIVLYVDPSDEPDLADADRVVLDLAAIRRGLQVMASEHFAHFSDVMRDADMTTADVFMQCCVFGKVIYG